MRYLRYVKKLRKQERKDTLDNGLSISAGQKRIAREQRKADRKAEKIKLQYERDQARKELEEFKAEQEKDFVENADYYRSEQEKRETLKRTSRKYRKRNRARLARFYMRYCRRRIIRGIKRLNPANFPLLVRDIRENRSTFAEFLIIFLHSTLLFVVAYLFIFFLGLLASSISGVFFEYHSIIRYFGIEWIVASDKWYGDSVKMVYSSGPIAVGIIAVFLAIAFSYIRTSRSLIKLFFLWSLLHGFNAFFGALLIGSLFGQGFGHAIIWSYISDTEKVIYSIVSITILILLGIFTTRSILISANSYYSFLDKSKQRFFIWAQIGLPFIFGNAIIGLLMFPQILEYNMTVSLTLAISVITILLGYRSTPTLYFEEEKPRIRLSTKIVLSTIAFIVIYRVVLTIGIPIGG